MRLKEHYIEADLGIMLQTKYIFIIKNYYSSSQNHDKNCKKSLKKPRSMMDKPQQQVALLKTITTLIITIDIINYVITLLL